MSASWTDQPHDTSWNDPFDAALVFAAVWGKSGGLSVWDTRASSAHPMEVARLTELGLSFANKYRALSAIHLNFHETSCFAS